MPFRQAETFGTGCRKSRRMLEDSGLVLVLKTSITKKKKKKKKKKN